jgi:hypothetical protein
MGYLAAKPDQLQALIETSVYPPFAPPGSVHCTVMLVVVPENVMFLVAFLSVAVIRLLGLSAPTLHPSWLSV